MPALGPALIRLLAGTAIMLRAATCFIVSPLPALRPGARGGTLHSKGRRSSPSCGDQVLEMKMCYDCLLRLTIVY